MKSTTVAVAAAAVALALSGCSALAESAPADESSGSNATVTETVEATAEATPEAEAAAGAEEADSQTPADNQTDEAAEEDDGTHKFGETAAYDDGLSVTVSKPTDFTPSGSASGHEGFPSSVQFTVKVVNKTGAPFDPTLMFLSMQSGNTEAGQIFDFGKGMEGSPNTTVLDGRETTFPVAFGVQDPSDLVLEVNTGDWSKDATIFVKDGK